MLVISGIALAAVPTGLQNPGFEQPLGAGNWSASTYRDGVYDPANCPDSTNRDAVYDEVCQISGSDSFTVRDSVYDTPSTVTVSPVEGTHMVRLGGPFNDSSQTQTPYYAHGLTQTFQVPASATTVQFSYNIFTFDYTGYDNFGVELLDSSGKILWHTDQGSWGEPGDINLKTSGWRALNVDLSAYHGQDVTFRIWAEGTQDDLFGTWAYVDGPGAPQFNGEIGGVVYAAGVGQMGAPVEACPINDGGPCSTSYSTSGGEYAIPNLPDGTYSVTAYPANSDTTDQPSNPVQVTIAGGDTVEQNLDLNHPTPPPPGVTVSGYGTLDNGEPIIEWADSTPITFKGCTGGTATWAITATNTQTEESETKTGSMSAQSVSGSTTTYAATIPALYPLHGDGTLTMSVSGCPTSSDDSTTTFPVYIDPSGSVVTTNGQPIVGATVTLLKAGSASGPFTPVANGSSIMSNANRKNPSTTDANGLYGWDVVAGYYEISATKSGCTDPANSSKNYVDSSPLTVPPAATGVKLTLACGKGISIPSSVNFGTAAPGSTVTKTLTVTNVGPGPLKVSEPALSGSSAFAITDNKCGTPVAIGGTCTMMLSFEPSGTGSSTGSLSVPSDGSQSPVTVALSGTGSTSSASHQVSIGKITVKGDKATIPVQCGGTGSGQCQLGLKLKVTEHLKGKKVIAVTASKSKKKVLTVASGQITVASGQTTSITLTLNHAGRKLLAAKHKLKTAMQLQALGGAAVTLPETLPKVTFKK